jgi:hypothetical protein
MKNIHVSLIDAMREIAKTGIAKLCKADLGGAKVNYRGIEQAMNEMSVILIKCGITVTPEYSDLSIQERQKGDPKDAKATRFATVKGAFTFAAEDQTAVRCTCYGEAMDSGDKAITKAQSVAFRTALFQQFVVPTMAMDPEGGDDGGADDLLDSWQATALEGLTKLQHRFTTEKPPADFWAKHSSSLKHAAMAADGSK